MANGTSVAGNGNGGIVRWVLNWIERAGNLLPEPATLFVIGAAIVMVISHVGYVAGWAVQPLKPRAVMEAVVDGAGRPVIDPATGQQQTKAVVDQQSGRPKLELVAEGEPVKAYSLLTSDGLYWCISHLVSNFTSFAPLGIVLTAMLGVGVAERTGMFGALLKMLATAVPRRALTPMVVFLGINSSLASDSGYVVLPPLAATLFLAVGRSPLAGIAAAFAGVAAGFSASLLISGGDALVAGITEPAARIVDDAYVVAPTCNWWFMIVSTVMLTFVGWFVTARFVEPRMTTRPPDEGGPAAGGGTGVEGASELEVRGLKIGGLAFAAVMAVVLAMIFIPGWPLEGLFTPAGSGKPVAKWSRVVVPIVFVAFLLPGLAYGIAIGVIKREKDAITCLIDAMKTIAPIIVMAFFAAQFVEFFKQSNLGTMLAMVGGEALAKADLDPKVIIVVFILIAMVINMFIASMSAKWLVLSPIFVPMFMMLGLSPELTQVAYRVGDSCTNCIAPLNAYLVIILAVMHRYAKNAGMGTLIAMMIPYSVVFAAAWSVLLLLWMWLGLPLGSPGPLWYVPGG